MSISYTDRITSATDAFHTTKGAIAREVAGTHQDVPGHVGFYHYSGRGTGPRTIVQRSEDGDITEDRKEKMAPMAAPMRLLCIHTVSVCTSDHAILQFPPEETETSTTCPR